MRKIFIIILSLYITNSYSQDLGLNYYSTGTGRNITAAFSKNFKTNVFGVGIGYNINSIRQPDDQNNIYYKRLYASNFMQHLSLNMYYDKYIFRSFKHIHPLVFYNFQLKYSTTRSSMYIVAEYDSAFGGKTPEDNLLYRNYIENFGPFLWVENCIGLGFRVDITDNLYLKQKAGLGVNLIIGEEPKLVKANVAWEFSGFINIGLYYKILNKADKTTS